MTMQKTRGQEETLDVGRRRTARKDNRSKICTSRGSRDRRIRLSAHTAIQFYDLQDRLGFDRPSNAIDWLMKQAKANIDVLVNDHCYQHLQSFDLSEAFRRTHGDLVHQDLNRDHFNGFDKSRDGDMIIPVAQGTDEFYSSSSTIRRSFGWNPNYDESEGFEYVNMEPCESSLHPTVADTLKNESYGLLGIFFEDDIQVQEAEIQENELVDRSYDHGYLF